MIISDDPVTMKPKYLNMLWDSGDSFRSVKAVKQPLQIQESPTDAAAVESNADLFKAKSFRSHCGVKSIAAGHRTWRTRTGQGQYKHIELKLGFPIRVGLSCGDEIGPRVNTKDTPTRSNAPNRL